MGSLSSLSLLVILTVVGFTTAAVVPSPKVNEESDPIPVKVTQHIRVSRKRRSVDDVKAGMEYFDFPKFMRFSFGFNNRLIDLNLTRCTYVNMDMNFHFSDRVSKHDFSDRFAMYRSIKQLAAVLVECSPSHCHLYGSVDIDGHTYSIESDRKTLQGHVLRKREPINIDEFSKTMYTSEKEDSSSTALANRRVRRSTATFYPECDVFEVQLLLDDTIWGFYMEKNGQDEYLAREEIWKYYTAVFGEVNLRFACIVDYISKFCDDLECEVNCLKVMLTGIEIDKDSSWTDFDNMKFEFTFKDGITSTFVDGWKALKRCGKIHKSKPNSDDWDIYMCLTRHDIAVKKRDRKHYAYFRTYTWIPSICESDKKYPSVVSESDGDGIDVQFIQNLLHSLGVGRDDKCDRIWVMKEDIDAPIYDPAAHGISWNIKKCALEKICDTIHDLNKGGKNCLRDHHFSQDEWNYFQHNSSTLFGKKFSADEQCKNKWGLDSVQCDPEDKGNLFPDDMCSTFIYCNTSSGCVCPVRVMSGTPCGLARHCYKGQCVPIPDRELGESCDCHSQCTTPNAHCDENSMTCVCDDGYVDDNGDVIGGNCTEGTPPVDDCDCGCNAFCVNDTCVCEPGFYDNDGTCDLQVCLGEPCFQTLQCFGENVNCGDMNICVCDFGYFVNDVGQCILYNGTLCDPCTQEPDSCTQEFTACGDEGFCECAGDTVEYEGECYGTNYGEPCTIALDTCSDANNICGEGGLCVCTEGYTFIDGVCVGSNLCDPCLIDLDTCDDGLKCGDLEYCVCENGGVPPDNECFGNDTITTTAPP